MEIEEKEIRLIFRFFAQQQSFSYTEPIVSIQNKLENKLKEEPNHIQSLAILAQIEYKYNVNENQSLKYYKRILELDPNDIDTRLDISYILFRKERSDVSIVQPLIDECIELNPDYWRIYYTIALKYLYEEKEIQSKRVLEEAYQKFPQEPWIAIFYAQALSAYSQSTAKALEIVDNFVKQNDLDFDILLRIATVYNLSGSQNLYLLYLQKSYQLNPKSAKGCNNLGHYYLGQNSVDKCLEYCQQSIQYDPKNEDSYYNIGLCYNTQNKNEEAVKYLKKCIEINKQYIFALNDLTYIYFNEIKDKDKALYYLKITQKQLPMNQYVNHFYSYIYNYSRPNNFKQDYEQNELIQFNLIKSIKQNGEEYNFISYKNSQTSLNNIYIHHDIQNI